MFAPLIAFASLGVTRYEFQQRLQVHGIGSGFHYPAMHLFGVFRKLGYQPGDCPNAERIGAETLTLPLFPAMSDADVQSVCGALYSVLEELSRAGA